MAGAGGDKGRMVGPRATARAGGTEGGVAVGAGGEEGRCMTGPRATAGAGGEEASQRAPARRLEREGKRAGRRSEQEGGWTE